MERYNYLTLYIFLTIIIIGISIIKKRTNNDSQKIIRLTNFFWVIPAKIFAIIYGFYVFMDFMSKIFFMIFEKNNDMFPPILLFFLNYGLFMALFVYALFGQELITLFIIFFIVSSLISYALSKSLGYSLFPYKIKKNDFWKWCFIILYTIIMILLIIPIAYIIAFIYRYDLVEDIPSTPEIPGLPGLPPGLPGLPSV